jgi:hypothetical protein
MAWVGQTKRSTVFHVVPWVAADFPSLRARCGLRPAKWGLTMTDNYLRPDDRRCRRCCRSEEG